MTNVKFDYEVVNSMKPLWLRPPKEVNASEHSEFYKSAFRAFDDPLADDPFGVGGPGAVQGAHVRAQKLTVRVKSEHVRRKCEQHEVICQAACSSTTNSVCCPRWLVFMRGIVDSEDLPLNVGREILQKSKMLGVIQRRLRKVPGRLADLQKNSTEYDEFWKNFRKYIKVGAVEEQGDVQKDLAKLCRFYFGFKSGMNRPPSVMNILQGCPRTPRKSCI